VPSVFLAFGAISVTGFRYVHLNGCYSGDKDEEGLTIPSCGIEHLGRETRTSFPVNRTPEFRHEDEQIRTPIC
jgi:hypothetical protein